MGILFSKEKEKKQQDTAGSAYQKFLNNNCFIGYEAVTELDEKSIQHYFSGEGRSLALHRNYSVFSKPSQAIRWLKVMRKTRLGQSMILGLNMPKQQLEEKLRQADYHDIHSYITSATLFDEVCKLKAPDNPLSANAENVTVYFNSNSIMPEDKCRLP